ncbi:MAG: hypothetical protein J6Y42_00560, partial [Bacilli bacterium]|nr:hypothetical protein [Bacilli bacterium]
TFESDEDNILEQEQENIIRSLKNHFKYNKVLIGKRNNGKKYIVFIPCIDSISRLKEEVELLSKNIAVSNRGTEGLSVINGKISVIIYPYSDIDEIVSDLAYANRKGKSINFYLPNKLFLRKNEGISDISLNVNNVGKLLSMISTLKNSPSIEQDKKIIGDALTHLIGYLNIDEAGLVLYKRDVDRYLVEVNASLDDRQTFGINKPVSFTFINSLENIIDEDGTYYFSNRNHANSSISKFFDVYGIRGGYFYRLSIDNNTYGMIYFINRNNSLILNSYIKEAILVICTFIDHFQQNRNYLSEVKHMNQRINDISKLSNLRLYTIDKNTFELVAFSETMKDRNINIEIGKKCHKCLYDRDTPCKDCPFITGKKKTYVENSILYETSMVLNKSDGNDIDFLISLPKDSLSDHNRFDVDYLTNSYYSFIDRIKALYLSRSKGYILTLTIDNYMDLNLKHGSEGYAFYIRKFVDKVVNSVKNVNRIYTFHDNVFIIVLPEMGRVDVVDAVEAMYNISKDTYQEENEERSVLNISYEAIKYPQTFDNERDLMQHIDRYLITKDIYKTDSLHFEENDYIRPASRKEFILTTIENAVTNNTFIIR